MAIASSIVDVDVSRRRARRVLSLTFSGNYTSGGDGLDLTAPSNPQGIAGAKAFGLLPTGYSVSNVPDGYTAEIVAGSALNNWKVKWFTASNTELTAGAYPAGISDAADVLVELVNKTNL